MFTMGITILELLNQQLSTQYLLHNLEFEVHNNIYNPSGCYSRLKKLTVLPMQNHMIGKAS
jgi:hypothetical protein